MPPKSIPGNLMFVSCIQSHKPGLWGREKKKNSLSELQFPYFTIYCDNSWQNHKQYYLWVSVLELVCKLKNLGKELSFCNIKNYIAW